MLSIDEKPPAVILLNLGLRAKDARLAMGWTRKTLSERSSVPESTIKRFENEGLIGISAMLDLAIALDMHYGLDSLFEPKQLRSLKDIGKKRMRGRR